MKVIHPTPSVVILTHPPYTLPTHYSLLTTLTTALLTTPYPLLTVHHFLPKIPYPVLYEWCVGSSG